MYLHIINQVLSVSSVSSRLLNKEMPIEKVITCSYTPGIYAEGYIAFVFLFVRSYVRSLLSVVLVEFMSKFSFKVSLSGYISLQPLIRKYSYLDHGSLRGSASMP